MELFLYDSEIRKRGINYLCGIDEAGRGPLAGPVFAAAVVFPENVFIEGLNDSKKLSEKKRAELFPIICEKAISYCIAFATEDEIDEINILNATYLAMKRAQEGLKVPADYAIVDGNRMPPLSVAGETVIKGDAKSASIAAASVLAKVSRDRLMCEIDKIYPQYGFAKHKGYGTKLHAEALKKFGPCKVHRKTFIKKILGESI